MPEWVTFVGWGLLCACISYVAGYAIGRRDGEAATIVGIFGFTESIDEMFDELDAEIEKAKEQGE